MKIALGGDHAGFPMKDPVREFLAAAGHAVEDFGTHSAEPVDFPDIARLVCGSVRDGKTERGVLVCGTGVGACIAGNKVPGIRAAHSATTPTRRTSASNTTRSTCCVWGRKSWASSSPRKSSKPSSRLSLAPKNTFAAE